MISVILFFLAGASRGLAELVGYEHGDSIFSAKVPQHSFWGAQSWRRKYRWANGRVGALIFPDFDRMGRLKKRYYKAFKIQYEERFLFSTTALVWLTDGMHLMNYLMKFFLIGACFASSLNLNLLNVGLYVLAWTGGFNLTYSFIFSRRLK